MNRSSRALVASLWFAALPALAQDPDLPGAAQNLETIPAGSWIIPMDNAKQNLGGGAFNLRSYGLVNQLLWNNVPVKWAIAFNKTKTLAAGVTTDTADFTADASRVRPTVIAAANLSFFGGPFIIHQAFVPAATPIIDAFNAANPAAAVTVYQLTSDTAIDIRYTLAHKPKVGALDDGGNANIHTDILDETEGFTPGTHYQVLGAGSVDILQPTECFTLLSEAHYNELGAEANPKATNISGFLNNGGNFLAQCEGINTYENNVNGRFQTTLGITEDNVNSANIQYPNAALSFSQFNGPMDGTEGGSWTDWVLNGGALKNNAHLHVQNVAGPQQFIASVSKLTPGLGSLAFYLGGHNYSGGTIAQFNGRRMYLNAVMTPMVRPSCQALFLQANLALTKTVDNPAPIWPEGNVEPNGPTVTFTITLTNNGPSPATGVRVTDLLPANLAYVSSLTSQGTYVPGTGVWTVGILTNGQSATLTLVAQLTKAETTITNTASITASDMLDTQASNNTASVDVIAATRATFRGVRVDRAGLVEFITSEQRGTRGFRIYETGGRVGSRELPITDGVIPAPLSSSFSPQVYRVRTRPLAGNAILIVEEETNGRRRRAGPFLIDSPRLRKGFERSLVREAMSRERKGQKRPRPPRGDAGGAASQGVVIEVEGDGLVDVPWSDLTDAGLPSRHARRRSPRLQLSREGTPVDFVADRVGVHFDATALSTEYTDKAAYVLTWNGVVAAAEAQPSKRGFPALPGFTRVEKNSVYFPWVLDGADPWLWAASMSGSPLEVDFELDRLEAPREAVDIRLGLVVSSDGPPVSLRAFVNDVEIGTAKGEATGLVEISGALGPNVLRSSGNRLHVEISSSSDSAWAMLDVLDAAVTLQPPREPSAFTTRPYRPAAALGDADYVIITHPRFARHAARVAQAKEDEGYRVAVRDVTSLYDRYAAGTIEPQAIKAALRNHLAMGKLKYVLLIGDDTFDPGHILGGPDESLIPSLMLFDNASGYIPSDDAFVDWNEDGRPDAAIGRLAVQSESQADVVTERIVSQAALLARARGHVFVSDNPGSGDVDFQAQARKLAAAVPPAEASLIDMATDMAGAHQRLVSAWEGRPLTVTYVGHGGPDLWADEELLSSDDAGEISATNGSPVVFAWTCRSQWFQYAYAPALHEALMQEGGGGALAAIGATGISQPEVQARLAAIVFREFLDGVPLGDALRHAKIALFERDPSARSVALNFGLLGDPTLRLEPRR